MKKLLYSPDYTEKIKNLKIYLDNQFGSDVRKRVIKDIGIKVRSLRDNENIGYSVRDMYGVDTDCLCFFIRKNYVFYKVDADCIYIINIYNEREDFMRNLFGIRTASDETEDYWNE